MKSKIIILLSFLAACFGAPPGFCTANNEGDNSTLAMLCRGAGVDEIDVRWRVAAGLDLKQAVDAALAQQAEAARLAGPVSVVSSPPPTPPEDLPPVADEPAPVKQSKGGK